VQRHDRQAVSIRQNKTHLNNKQTKRKHTMKLTHTHNMKRKSGMTLLELTVVILVLLSLISILFIGARAWKRGSDRSANIMNLRNVQQAVRGHANMNNIIEGQPVTRIAIFGAADDGVDAYLRFPQQVATVTYTTPAQVNPAEGVLYLVASADGLEGETYGPKVGDTSDW